jgi:hypothetical protein
MAVTPVTVEQATATREISLTANLKRKWLRVREIANPATLNGDKLDVI